MKKPYLDKRNRKRRAQWQRRIVEQLPLRWWAVPKIMSVHKFAKTMRHRWNRRKHPNRRVHRPAEHCSIRTHWHQRNQRLPGMERAQKTTAMKWLLLPFEFWLKCFNLINKLLYCFCHSRSPPLRHMKCITTFWTITLGAKQRALKTWMLVSKCN